MARLIERGELDAHDVLPTTTIDAVIASVFDGLVVAAALEAGCATLWSEDMHHGLVIDERLKILNPFIEDDPGSP